MRKMWLTLTLVAMIALPVLAQRGGFGGFGLGGMSGDMLLMNKSVQKELKLDDKQTAALKEANKAAEEHMAKAREAFQDMDREKGMEHMQKANEVRTKALKKFKDDTLTSEQRKRFAEIEVYVGTKVNKDPNVFKETAITKALKLSDKQQETVKETLSDLDKDVKEVQADAKGDFSKMKGMFKKMQSLRGDAFEKITKSLTEDQQKTLKELAGKEFEFKMDNPFGKGGKKGKKGKKKDDF
jgi:hypothetical protein